MATLSNAEIDSALDKLPGWNRGEGRIIKEFKFKGFPGAVDFVGRLVEPAESANHHPDLEIHYNRVVVALSTHSEGGVTAKDTDLAAVIDSLA
ncbi:MAG: 4a-hydroxytetrahydrobiopterin dehydratase [Acidimicrobiia bacterium]